VGETKGANSTSRILDAAPEHRPCLAAQHVVMKHDGRTCAAVALASVLAVRQEWPSQEVSARFGQYQLMISERDSAFERDH
jgi:hypothetical protein